MINNEGVVLGRFVAGSRFSGLARMQHPFDVVADAGEGGGLPSGRAAEHEWIFRQRKQAARLVAEDFRCLV